MTSFTFIARRLVLVTLIVAIFSACSTKRIPFSSEHVKELTPSTFTVVHYTPEPFMIWRGEQKVRSTALMFFGAIGGGIEAGMQLADAKEEGAKFISQTQLTDPISQVEIRFLNAWQPELGVTVREESQLASDDDEEDLQKKFKTDYVLDFKTTGWMITFMPRSAFSSDPKTFRAVYAARARLVRLRDKTVVWQDTCQYDRDSSLTHVLTVAELAEGDGGTTVKVSMQTLAVNCADLLWRQFFGRSSGPDLPTSLPATTYLQ